ncbi:MAG: alpha/beta fold hydrolase [Pseudorhodoplanes sp.]|uniref:alpha/beta fold hydrolase n=1 Tax=Pseudorhodoplanes sp. TaxID=1934341 RepID=UPI003D1507C3
MPDNDLPSPTKGVVFIHGVGGSARAWQWQAESFRAAGYIPLALDLPGYGGRPAIERIDFEEFSEDVEAQIAAAGMVRPVLIGHSLGGMIAQTMLRRKPDGYQAVVLVGTSPAFGKPDGDFQKKFVADRLAPLRSGRTMAELAAGMINEIIGPNANPEGKQIAIASMASAPAATYQACVEAIVTFEERANLGNIRVPTMCLVGEFDTNAPAPMMERMAAKIPGAKFTLLPGLGHLPNLEDPAAFDAAVLGFLRDLDASEPTTRSAAG